MRGACLPAVRARRGRTWDSYPRGPALLQVKRDGPDRTPRPGGVSGGRRGARGIDHTKRTRMLFDVKGTYLGTK
ncbi:hypothetical protein Pta02_10490 [Planobispora takensis]|uniref:Uncharacterized protein n=1 Tax=Planobispora takensis TaxID=1367882 RepID=A0A8J3SUL5_9ACTN|nr:hypothetical protein Pta02_10490 [Planobispora takensis]